MAVKQQNAVCRQNRIPVLIARDRHGEMTDGALRDLSEVSVTRVLKPVVAQDLVLCTDGNRLTGRLQTWRTSSMSL